MVVKDIILRFRSVGLDNIRGFNKVMNSSITGLKDMTTKTGTLNKRFKNMNTLGAKVGYTARMMTHGLRGFRMEMLGVMFFGMMLGRTLKGLIQPAMEAFGVFDLWRVMLMVLFIPVIQELFPLFLQLTEFFMNLSPQTQEIIGWITIFGIVLSTLIFIIGSFSLGLGSIILLNAMLVSLLGLGLLPILGIIAGVIAVVVGVVMLFKGHLEGLGLIIAGVGIILTAFLGPIGLVIVALGVAAFLIIKYWTPISNFFSNLFNSIIGFFQDATSQISDILLILFAPALLIFKYWEPVKEFFINLWNDIVKIFETAYNVIKGIIDSLMSFINSLLSSLGVVGEILGSGTSFIGKTLGIPGFQHGGIVTRPTLAMVGEAGPEAVVPLGRGGGFGGITINQYNTISAFSIDEIERMINSNNSKLVDELRRMQKI